MYANTFTIILKKQTKKHGLDSNVSIFTSLPKAFAKNEKVWSKEMHILARFHLFRLEYRIE